MTSSSSLARALRRLRRAERLRPRPLEALPLAEPAVAPRALVLDTTVYIDQLQGRFPPELNQFLRRSPVWHSAVAMAEVAVPLGRLDSAHPGTRDAVRQITAFLDRIPDHRVVAPDSSCWQQAAIACGIVARARRAEAPRFLNDGLIFFGAQQRGATVLTRNHVDFDLLAQLDPEGKVLIYRT